MPDLTLPEHGLPLEKLRMCVKLRRFEQTSSTKLELQTLLWALSEIQTSGLNVQVHTDSQNIIGLPARRAGLEQSDYRSASGKRLNHYLLYQQFYRLTDQLACQLIKVRGHQLSRQKDEVDRLFTLVDRASRQALRAELRS